MNDAVRVEVRGLTKYFGTFLAVDHIDFEFRGGEVHGFIGPNGAGKTTTMRMLALLETPDEGDAYIDGVSLLENPDRVRPLIGFMPDYLDSYPTMTVEDYLDFYARAYGLPSRVRTGRVADVVGFTGLGGHMEREVAALSKGWKQRLSLARVILNDPKVVILDEPAAGLDPRARIELRRLVRALADHGRAVLISSHILTELAEMCEAVTIIENGRVQATDTVDALQRRVDRGHRVAVRLVDEPGAADRLAAFLAAAPGVSGVETAPDGAAFLYDGEPSRRADILAALVDARFRVTDFHHATSDLEDTFIALTGAADPVPPAPAAEA